MELAKAAVKSMYSAWLLVTCPAGSSSLSVRSCCDWMRLLESVTLKTENVRMRCKSGGISLIYWNSASPLPKFASVSTATHR